MTRLIYLKEVIKRPIKDNTPVIWLIRQYSVLLVDTILISLYVVSTCLQSQSVQQIFLAQSVITNKLITIEIN